MSLRAALTDPAFKWVTETCERCHHQERHDGGRRPGWLDTGTPSGKPMKLCPECMEQLRVWFENPLAEIKVPRRKAVRQ